MTIKSEKSSDFPSEIFENRDAQNVFEAYLIDGDCFLSPQNAAKYLDVSVKFIYELIQSGELESQPIGGRLKRVRKGILDKWLTSQALKHGRSK